MCHIWLVAPIWCPEQLLLSPIWQCRGVGGRLDPIHLHAGKGTWPCSNLALQGQGAWPAPMQPGVGKAAWSSSNLAAQGEGGIAWLQSTHDGEVGGWFSHNSTMWEEGDMDWS